MPDNFRVRCFFKNSATSDGGGTLLDVDAFDSNSPYAGYISTKFLAAIKVIIKKAL